jgi:hypothetical protein
MILLHERSEVVTVAGAGAVVLWIATPCSLVAGYKYSGGIYYLHFIPEMKAVCSSETLSPT